VDITVHLCVLCVSVILQYKGMLGFHMWDYQVLNCSHLQRWSLIEVITDRGVHMQRWSLTEVVTIRGGHLQR